MVSQSEEERGQCSIIRKPFLTCRTSVQIWPVCVKNWIPCIHSSVLNLVSLAKSCKCLTSLSKTYLLRASLHWLLMRTTFSVMLSMVRSLSGGMRRGSVDVAGGFDWGCERLTGRSFEV